MDTLAHVILEAQRIKEESFDTDAAKKASTECVYGVRSCINYRDFYRINDLEAAKIAVSTSDLPESMVEVVYLLNKNCWNDIQMWAIHTKEE